MELLDRQERPAYVRFERVPVESPAESLKQGHYVAVDVDFALITPPYSKDIFKIKVEQWKRNMVQDVQNGRLPPEWQTRYLADYELWKNGQEIPLHGTAIRGWGVISPAMQENLIHCGILTIEDLAGANDEGLKRIGMGSLDLKNKAIAWISQLSDKGPLTQEIAAVKAENALLKTNQETQTRQIAELTAILKANENAKVVPLTQPQVSISAADILDDTPPDLDTLRALYMQKFGKPAHHMMKAETIQAALDKE